MSASASPGKRRVERRREPVAIVRDAPRAPASRTDCTRGRRRGRDRESCGAWRRHGRPSAGGSRTRFGYPLQWDSPSIMPSARASSSRPGAPPAPRCTALRASRAIVVVGGSRCSRSLLLAVRFVVFPRIEAYRDTLIATLSSQLGQPVEIDSLTTGWDGWNPKLVIGGLRVLDRARIERDAAARAARGRPDRRVDVAAAARAPAEGARRSSDRASRSGATAPACCTSLASNSTRRRRTDDLPLTDWILRQRQIVIRDALVTWNDDLRNAPQLVLDRVQFRLENRFGRHRFGVCRNAAARAGRTARPARRRPGRLVARLAEGAAARLYVRLDYADVEAWREWLPLPVGDRERARARCASGSISPAGEAREIIADLELADVKRASRRASCPSSISRTCRAASGWRRARRRSGSMFATRARFRHAERRAPRADDFHAYAARRRARACGGRKARVRSPAAASRSRDLAAYLPLSERWRADLARFAPRGTLTRGRAAMGRAGRGAHDVRRRGRVRRISASPRRRHSPASTGSPEASRRTRKGAS